MDPELYKAARLGDVIFLQGINRSSTLLSQTTPKCNTILHVAAEFGHSNFFKEAVNLSPSLFDLTNSKEETALHVAARVGCSEVVDFVIAHSKTLFADIEKDQGGYVSFLRKVNVGKDNALHSAARNGHLAVAKSLIEADHGLLDSVNAAEESPFYVAVAKEHQDIAKLILSNCGSCLYGGANGTTVLHAALYYQLNETIKDIVKKRSHMIREADALGWTPLHYAAHFGNVKAVQLFLKYDSSAAYISSWDGESALHIATFRGCTDVMEEIMKFRPDITDLLDNKGRTALHAAIIGGQENAVRFILSKPELVGMVNEADEDGNTPLHLAALHKKYGIISTLARDSRVDIRATNKKNLTALGIYIKYQESGFAAAKVYFMLKETYGVQDMRAWVNANVKKLLSHEPKETIAAKTIHAEQKREWASGERAKMLDIHLLVATLIATVTFTAAFTLPGGYQNDGLNEGMAVLSSNLAFRLFVIFDTLAFCCSIAAVYLQFGTSGGGYYERERFIKVAVVFIFIAILCMVLAFASGIFVVLEKCGGLGLTGYITAGCFIVPFVVRWFVDPLGKPDLGLKPLRKPVRNLLFRYGII